MTPLQHQFQPPPRHRPAASAPVSSAATNRLEAAVGGELARFLLGALAGDPTQGRARP